jgi:hypothetical protein
MELIRFGSGGRDLLRVAKDVLRVLPRLRLLRKFRSFQDRFMKLSDPWTQDDLSAGKARNYSVLVSGSDQLWNPAVTGAENRFDDAYLLGFAEPSQFCMSYATSVGGYQIPEQPDGELVTHLKRYKAIAVREADTASKISALLNTPVEHVLDPTLLLNKKEWTSILGLSDEKGVSKEPYVLVYAVAKDVFFSKAVEALTKRIGLKVISIDQDLMLGHKSSVHLMDSGPLDFIQLFANASFVVTNSFHGTAFSVNFNVPFAAVRPRSGANRILSFLNSTALNERFVQDLVEVDGMGISVDFNDSNIRLESLRARSLAYVEKTLKVALSE